MEEKKSVLDQHIKLVLNSGEEILDSATIPVEWFFSDELIAKKPRYIVICDHEHPVKEFREKLNISSGYRYGFAVKELVGYIQLHKPGRHHFVAVVFYGDEKHALMNARSLLKKDNPYFYSVPIHWGEKFNYDEVSVVEFEVPEGVFAKKPENFFSRFVWAWTNRWYDTPPVDECAYRKRKIFAFTLQPPIFLIGRLLWGVNRTLYTLIGAFILLFLGWRPIPVWENVWRAWKAEDFEDDLRKFGSYSWRVWKVEPRKTIPIWAVPAILSGLALGVGVVVFGLIVLAMITGIQLFLIFLAVAVVIIFSTPMMVRKVPKIAEYLEQYRLEAMKEMESEQVVKDQKYLMFLKAYVNGMPDNVPRSVDVRSVIRRVNAVTKFRLSFWATKAKVCRPFSR